MKSLIPFAAIVAAFTVFLLTVVSPAAAPGVAATLAPPVTAGGTVKSVSDDGKQITVTIGSGKSAKDETFRVNTKTKIALDNEAAQVADLKPGTKVTITYDKATKEVFGIKATSAKSAESKPESAEPDSTKPGASKTEKPKSQPSTKTTAGNPNDKDRKSLVGTWQGYVVEGKGENPNRGAVHLEIVITPDKMTSTDLQTPSKSFGEGTFRLDASAKLKTLDPIGTGGPEKGKAYLGIYILEGDTLKWCVANPGKPRPQEFASKTGAGQFLMILKRQATGK